MEAHHRYRPYSAPKLKDGQQKQQVISLLLFENASTYEGDQLQTASHHESNIYFLPLLLQIQNLSILYI